LLPHVPLLQVLNSFEQARCIKRYGTASVTTGASFEYAYVVAQEESQGQPNCIYMEDDDDAMDVCETEPDTFNSNVAAVPLERSAEASMIRMEPYFLEDQLSGAGACRNGPSALSALLDQVRGWLETGELSAVPERIQHAFLHVRDYALQNGGSLELEFVCKTLDR